MLELEHGFRVVDVHAQLTPNERNESQHGQSISPDRLEREMHQAGIVKAVVYPGSNPKRGYVAPNNSVARLSVERPFVAFARINGSKRPPTGVANTIHNRVASNRDWHTTPQDIEQYAYDDRFHGFALDPSMDGIPEDAVIDELESVGLPLLIRGSVDIQPEFIAQTFLGRSFPVIIAHFGGYPLDRALMDETIDLCDRFDDCYLDTSFVRFREHLERALLEHPDRVFFGSGTPAAHPNVGIMEILTLDVSEDKLWRTFSKNACRVITALRPETE